MSVISFKQHIRGINTWIQIKMYDYTFYRIVSGFLHSFTSLWTKMLRGKHLEQDEKRGNHDNRNM